MMQNMTSENDTSGSQKKMAQLSEVHTVKPALKAVIMFFVSSSKRFSQEVNVNFPLCLNILLEFTRTG